MNPRGSSPWTHGTHDVEKSAGESFLRVVVFSIRSEQHFTMSSACQKQMDCSRLRAQMTTYTSGRRILLQGVNFPSRQREGNQSFQETNQGWYLFELSLCFFLDA